MKMSYYRPSFSQTVAMSRGGGSSRGYGNSFRGSSRGSSSWGGSRGHSSSRGSSRFNSSSYNSNNYDARKFSGSSSGDRYGSSKHDDYKRSYKSDSYGSSRDRSSERSSSSKRMRTGSSHDRSFGDSSSSSAYNNNQSSSSGRYGDGDHHHRRSFDSGGGRRPGSSSSSSGRKDDFRKPLPPPPPVISSPSSRGYRGSRMSTRGSYRGGGGASQAPQRRGPPPMIVRRRLNDVSYGIRKRYAGGPPRSGYRSVRRVRSNVVRRRRVDSSDEKPSEDEDEEVAGSGSEKADEDSTSDKENDSKPTETVLEKPDEVKVKIEDENVEKKEGEEETAAGVEKAADVKVKKEYKLKCPHCHTTCQTFAKYSLHLQSGRHASAMRKVALKQKTVLGQMRLVQRRSQRELEEISDDLAPRTSWCPLCKLNYKQSKQTHQASQAHKDMKKFLMPVCTVCKSTFKSPMIYESHVCSISHLKMLIQKKSTAVANGDQSDKEGSGNEDLENLVTIDSVGDMDEEGDGGVKKEPSSETKTTSPKEKINVGIEKIRKVDVYYCDLCRMYLTRASDEEEMKKIIAKHCKNRTHLQKYIRYKEDKELTKRAERLQRKETEEKVKAESVKSEETNVVPAAAGGDEEAERKEDSTNDEKVWSDVDKDLGNILADEEHRASDDEDEDGERYDRFRNSEEQKKNDEKNELDVKMEDDDGEKVGDDEEEEEEK